MRGPQHALDPRHRPRRDRDPGGVEKRAARARARAARSSAARRSSSASGSGASSTARRSSSSTSASAPPATTSASASRSTRATSRAVYRVFVELYDKGYIYRDNYMVNWDPGIALGDLRPRGREPRGRGHALLDRLPARGRRPGADRRHRAARRRCWPTPRSPCNPDDERYRDLVGEHGDPAAGRAPAADHRRRARRPRVRHRRAEDHARATTRTTSRSAARTGSRRSA